MKKNRKVLLTGSCGYIGSVLTGALLDAGYEVVGYDIMWFGNVLPAHPNLTVIRGDIRDIDRVPMDGVDAVLHLANVANDPCGDLSPKLSWEVNVLASKFLIEKAIKKGVGQFVFASSGSVYGVKDEPEVTEDLELLPITDYNKTKMISERVLLSYASDILVQILRPATVCGFSPRMRLDLSVNMLTMQALKNKRITVFGGAQSRPNIHITDMVRAYLHLLEKGPSVAGVFNAGFENLAIGEIAARIAKRIPSEVVVSESNDPRSYHLSSRKLLDTGFTPQKTVEDAIGELQALYAAGRLRDSPGAYNVKTMQALGLG